MPSYSEPSLKADFSVWEEGLPVNARLLAGSNAIFTDAIALVSEAKECIRATALHDGISKNPLKDEYFNALIRRLKESRGNGLGVEFRIAASSKVVAAVLERASVYHTHGVQDSVRIKETAFSIGMAVLVVDEAHVHVSFPQSNPDDALSTTLSVHDCPHFAKRVAEWFDTCLWQGDDLPVPSPSVDRLVPQP